MIFTSSSTGWESWEGPSTYKTSAGDVCCTWLKSAGLFPSSGGPHDLFGGTWEIHFEDRLEEVDLVDEQ